MKNNLSAFHASHEMRCPGACLSGRQKQKGKEFKASFSYRESEASLGYIRSCLVVEAVLNLLFVTLVAF